mmetsp:Transcript_18974/g.33259  ORF Transcript_18974/g.33259 Transcript_18974/m.33259 type:complete len:99 (+) Transcript_18974:137-433(+)
MKKYQAFCIKKALIPCALWVIGLIYLRFPSFMAEPPSDSLIFFIFSMPLWMIIALGLYAAGAVIYGTLTFHDCSQAAIELDNDVKRAHTELAKKGFKP